MSGGDPDSPAALGDLGRAEAARSAAFLAAALPAALRPLFGESFIRSHVLYGEFVCRLVLGIAGEIGLGAALAAPGPSREIAARAALDPSRAQVPLDWMLRYLAARGFIEELRGGSGETPGRIEEARGRTEEVRGRIEEARGRTEEVRGRIEEARGRTEEAEGPGEPRYHAPRLLPTPDPAPVREEQRRHDASWMPAYVLAETVAADYPAFLRGRAVGEDVLFAPRRLRLWIDYFSNDNGLYAVNNRVGAVAADLWLRGPGAVVLELGGGLASGTLALLGRLEAAGRLGAVAGYRFTEPVSAFLRRGEQTLRARYPGLPGWSFGALDMNRPFAEQGVAPESVSMVYAVNTLHAARDLDFTLGEVLRALAPGGRLVAAECVRSPEPIYADFVFNLSEAFRAQHLDARHRPHGGFLAPEHWRAALEAAGFADLRFLPDLARVRAGVPDFSVAAIGALRPADR